MPPTTAKAARMSPLDSHALDLDQLSRRNRLRALRPRLGHDFSSNDYLGLAADGSLRPAIMEAPGWYFADGEMAMPVTDLLAWDIR